MGRTDDLRVIPAVCPPFKCCASCVYFTAEYEDHSESGWCDHPEGDQTRDRSGFWHSYRSKGKLVVIVEKNSSCSGYEPKTP